jgi:diguanylate cyclase (GGDEF)-like protein
VFSWSNWFIQAVIAMFFISGFVVSYHRLRSFMWSRRYKTGRRQRIWTASVLTGFVLLLACFSVLASWLDPANQAGYLNWALYMLIIPMIDTQVNPWEYGVRAAMVLTFWSVSINLHDLFSIVSIFSISAMLVLVWFERGVIAKVTSFTVGISVWSAVAFWLTQTQLSMGNILMSIVMSIAISLFSVMYWSSARVEELEHVRLVNEVNRDALTNAGSYFAFKDDMMTQMSLSRRHLQPMTLAMYDLDYFKSINDTYGHQAGNTVLIEVTKAVQALLEAECDSRFGLYRTGGEEFNVVFLNLTAAQVAKIGQKIVDHVQHMIILHEGRQIKLTLSMGITSLRNEDNSLEDFYERADRSLYISKQSGRNRLTVEGELMNDARVN